MKPTVYIETSVVSYLTARPSRDFVAATHQQLTRNWWKNVLPRCAGFVSAVVLEEAAQGDPSAAQRRLEKLSSFTVLQVLPDIRELAETYFTALAIPEKARPDSYHLALAAWHSMDYLVSWNCTHIVSGRVRMKVEEMNAQLGIRTPIICTPEELMEV